MTERHLVFAALLVMDVIDLLCTLNSLSLLLQDFWDALLVCLHRGVYAMITITPTRFLLAE